MMHKIISKSDDPSRTITVMTGSHSLYGQLGSASSMHKSVPELPKLSPRQLRRSTPEKKSKVEAGKGYPKKAKANSKTKAPLEVRKLSIKKRKREQVSREHSQIVGQSSENTTEISDTVTEPTIATTETGESSDRRKSSDTDDKRVKKSSKTSQHKVKKKISKVSKTSAKLSTERKKSARKSRESQPRRKLTQGSRKKSKSPSKKSRSRSKSGSPKSPKKKRGKSPKGKAKKSRSKSPKGKAKKSRSKSPKGKAKKSRSKSPKGKAKKSRSKSPKKTRGSRTSSKGKKSRSSAGSKKKGGKKGKRVKEKVIKLNRKPIYKDMRNIEKRMAEENVRKRKLEWEKEKLFFYWNCAVGKQLEVNKRNARLKRKEESMNLELKHALPREYWRKMHDARLSIQDSIQAKYENLRLMITQLRDSQKAQADALFKDIQTTVKDTYLVGQQYLSNVIGIRTDYTKNMTSTLFQARENARVLEIEQNCKYGPIMEEFEEEINQLKDKVPQERRERLQIMLDRSRNMLVEMVNVYMNILHHNFIEICYTADVIKELKAKEKRLDSEKSELVKKKKQIKERTEYLQDRISNLKRQVNAGKEARKKLHRVLEDQELLQNKADIALINRELAFQENMKLQSSFEQMSGKVDRYYLKAKKDFLKTVIVKAGVFKERASQLNNYNATIKHVFQVENDFLASVKTFKNHEEFEDPKEGIKMSFGSFHPYTLDDLEKETEGFKGSLHTAIIFFGKRLQEHYLTLDDLHFFIKRRSPLNYLNTLRQEESELANWFSSEIKQAKDKLEVNSAENARGKSINVYFDSDNEIDD